MSRWFALVLLTVACGEREVDVVFYTPETCCVPVAPDRPCVEDPCPLRSVRSLRIAVEEADGTVGSERCMSAPADLCAYEDFSSLTLLEGVSPNDGVELQITGHEGVDCDEVRVFGCESFGENVIDLREDGTSEAPLWCDCPRAISD